MASDEGLPKAEAVAEFLTIRLGRPVAATKIGAVVVGRRRLGRITIANCDAGASASIRTAIDRDDATRRHRRR